MCTLVGGEIFHRGNAYTKGEKTLCLLENSVLFVFLLALWYFELCFVFLIASCLYVGYAFLCYCALLNACSDNYLLYYVIFVVISLWLFWYMIKLLTCFTSCLLDRNLLITLYLSFYYLLYLEGLMCFVQVSQVTSIYVSSVSQEEKCAHWKGKCLCLCPCCFCKLLGFVSMSVCRLLWFVPCFAAFMFCCLILLAKCYVFSLSILTLVPL